MRSHACSHCSQVVQVDPAFVETRMQCPHCGELFELAARPAQSAPSTPQPGDFDPFANQQACVGPVRGDGTSPGRNVPPRAAALAQPATDAPLQICPLCAAPLQPGSVICVACGFDRRRGEQIARDKRLRLWPKRASAVWGVFLLLGILSMLPGTSSVMITSGLLCLTIGMISASLGAVNQEHTLQAAVGCIYLLGLFGGWLLVPLGVPANLVILVLCGCIIFMAWFTQWVRDEYPGSFHLVWGGLSAMVPGVALHWLLGQPWH